MMYRFTEEQMQTLSRFEGNLRNAAFGDWCRQEISQDVDLIHSIYVTATGSNMPRPRGCGVCLLNLLRDVGRIYFAQKEEQEEQKPKRKKIKVKTKKVKE